MYQYQFPQHLSKGRLILILKTNKLFPSIFKTRALIVQSPLTKIILQTIMNKLKQK